MRNARIGRGVAVLVGAASLIGATLVIGSGPAASITGAPTSITQPVTAITNTTATFNGTVNPNGGGTKYSFEYGTSISYGLQIPVSPTSIGSGTVAVPVPTMVTGLTPGTTYDVQLVASNGSGVGDGGNVMFTTSGTAPTGAPTVVTTAATAIGSTTATLNGTVNPNGHATTYQFQYGTTLAYGSFTTLTSAGSGSSAVPVSATIGPLAAGTQYFFQLEATGNSTTVFGGGQIFTTTSAAGSPIVVTTAATSVTGTTATLNGTVNPNGHATTYQFEYGTTLAYGTLIPVTPASAGSGIAAVPVSASISGLTPGVTYDFNLMATGNSTTTTGANQSFLANGGLIITMPATAIAATSATLNGSVNPAGLTTTYVFEYGTSPSLATFVSTPSTSAGNGSAPVAVLANITGLTPGTTYYFELVANNGAPLPGGILSFMTTGGSQVTQLGGTDAIGTALLLSQTAFPVNGSAGAVVLARSDFFADALAGDPLAAATGGPMLITQGAAQATVIDPRVLVEIQRVLPVGGTVYILGGNLALNPNIDNQLKFLGYNVVRLAGVNLFATAVLIAQQLGNPGVIFEATGNSFFDALSAVPAAIASGAAILLTNGAQQAPETAAYLAANPSDVRFTIGGSLAAGGADPGATNVSGADLYATSAAVASRFFAGAHLFGAATSASFSDALTGGLFMVTGGRLGPLLIVNPNPPVPSQLLGYLTSLAPGTPGYVFGGLLAVTAAAVSALQAAVG